MKVRRMGSVFLLTAAVLLLAGCRNQAVETMGDALVSEDGVSGEAASEDGAETDETKEDAGENPEDADSAGTAEENAQAVEAMAEPEPEPEPVKVKGIYVTGPIAGHEKMQELIQLVDDTELNAVVIDIKNDSGEVTYKMQTPTVLEIGAGVNYIRDVEGLLKQLKEHDIYTIARIVAFKDPILAEAKPDLSLKTTAGEIFRDKDKLAWVNPYNKGVWDYLMEIAAEAARIGFDEVQFDYIRFSTDSRMKDVDFGSEAGTKTRMDIVTEFTQYAYETLSPLGVKVAADVYATIIHNPVDADIVGQNFGVMAQNLDFICPMVYPSHYSKGVLDIENPDGAPYDTVYRELQEASKILDAIPEGTRKAVTRVWLQDFTASWLSGYTKYGPEEVRKQIQAVYDAGYEEWILWNAKNNYTKDALHPKDYVEPEHVPVEPEDAQADAAPDGTGSGSAGGGAAEGQPAAGQTDPSVPASGQAVPAPETPAPAPSDQAAPNQAVPGTQDQTLPGQTAPVPAAPDQTVPVPTAPVQAAPVVPDQTPLPPVQVTPAAPN